MRRYLSWLAALLLAAAAAAAQPLYKSTMPDGRVVYGETPEPGAQRVERLAPPPPKTGTTIVTPGEKARAERSARERAAAEGAQRDLDEARAELRRAEAGLEKGREPLPGERLGTVGGASRLTDAYWERQKELEKAVESARKRLDDVQRAGR